MIESGLILLNKLFRFKLINNLYLFKSKYLLKKKGKNNINIGFIKQLRRSKKLRVNLKNDELFKIKVK